MKNLQGPSVYMDLFGRKQRIEELEAELEERETELTGRIEDLEARLEKEQERAREAAAAKQDAEERVNRLEDKIQSLEDRLDDESDGRSFDQDHHDLDLAQTTELLENLERLSYRSSKARTIYTRPDDTMTGSETGEIVIADPHIFRHAIRPPIPVTSNEAFRSDGFVTDMLRAMIEDRYCLLHLTAGGSGIAMIEDGRVETSTIVDADIKAKHTKGGYSQKRFERRRDHEIDEHIDAVIEAARPILEEGYRTLFLAGGPDLTEQARELLEQESVPFSSRVSRIDDEDDLEQSFRTGFRFRLQRLTDDRLDAAEKRL